MLNFIQRISNRRMHSLIFLLLACMVTTGWAQTDWPKAKPVTLLVAFAAGSSTDIVARNLTQKLGEITGKHLYCRKQRGGRR